MIQAYVDQLFGDSARLLIGEEEVAVTLPLHVLPPATHEGTVLRIHMTIDGGATLRRAAAKKQEQGSRST